MFGGTLNLAQSVNFSDTRPNVSNLGDGLCKPFSMTGFTLNLHCFVLCCSSQMLDTQKKLCIM